MTKCIFSPLKNGVRLFGSSLDELRLTLCGYDNCEYDSSGGMGSRTLSEAHFYCQLRQNSYLCDIIGSETYHEPPIFN